MTEKIKISIQQRQRHRSIAVIFSFFLVCFVFFSVFLFHKFFLFYPWIFSHSMSRDFSILFRFFFSSFDIFVFSLFQIFLVFFLYFSVHSFFSFFLFSFIHFCLFSMLYSEGEGFGNVSGWRNVRWGQWEGGRGGHLWLSAGYLSGRQRWGQSRLPSGPFAHSTLRSSTFTSNISRFYLTSHHHPHQGLKPSDV